MKASDANGSTRTDLKPVDHEQFFDAMDSPPMPTEALRAAFRRQKESPSHLDADLLTND